ncbi:MAG: hypothetical protein U0R52_03510 [Solirubrobacterales bacterium]
MRTGSTATGIARLCAASLALLAMAAPAVAGLAGCGASGGETTGAARTAKRKAAPVGAAAKSCAKASLAGGGRAGSGGTARTLRVTGVGCRQGSAVLSAWVTRGCAPGAGESRSSCTVRRFRCLSVRGGRGVSVSCSRPGRSISFLWVRSRS